MWLFIIPQSMPRCSLRTGLLPALYPDPQVYLFSTMPYGMEYSFGYPAWVRCPGRVIPCSYASVGRALQEIRKSLFLCKHFSVTAKILVLLTMFFFKIQSMASYQPLSRNLSWKQEVCLVKDVINSKTSH